MRPLSRDEVAAITTRLTGLGQWRDLTLFRMGIDSMLRGSDLTCIRVSEVIDHNGAVVDEAQVRMQKTGEIAAFAITQRTKLVLEKWLATREAKNSEWLFPGLHSWKPMTVVRYRQIAKSWFKAIGLNVKHYSTHSIRRTKATIMYDETNDIKAVSELLGHTTIRMTEKYIGMTRKKALDLARKIDV